MITCNNVFIWEEVPYGRLAGKDHKEVFPVTATYGFFHPYMKSEPVILHEVFQIRLLN